MQDRPPFVRLALFIGLCASAIELAIIAVQQGLLDEIVFVGRDVWWTAPLVNITVFGAVGAAFLLMSRLWPARLWLVACCWVALFLATMSILFAFPRIYRWAMLLLAAGAATRIATTHWVRGRGLAGVARRTVPWLLVLIVVVAVILRGGRRWEETRTIAAHEAPTGAPNVLLIVLDTVRAGSMSVYGYEKETTPFLTARARHGAVFTNAFSPAPWTLPSHVSMLTGLWAPELSTDWLTPLETNTPTLASILTRVGYATGGFAANIDYVGTPTGIAAGFAHYDDYVAKPGLILRSASLGRSIGRNRLLRGIWGAGDTLGRRDAPEISEAFLRWVDDLSDERPWFAMLNYYDAHRPSLPPEPYRSRFATPGVTPDPRFRQFNDQSNSWTEKDAAAFRAAYDGAIAYLDSQLEALFAELERRKRLDRTIVVVTSDHGEEFGEHRFWDHGNSLYLASVQVPLIILAPGRVPATVIADAVSTRDVSATISDLLTDLKPATLPGQSLARYWKGLAAGDDLLVIGVRQASGHPDFYPVSAGNVLGLVRGRLRYILNESTGAEEMYDYRADPGERNNLAGNPAFASELDRFRADSRKHRHQPTR